MRIYLHDGSLEGFLCVLERVFSGKGAQAGSPEEIEVAAEREFIPDLFTPANRIACDPRAAARFTEAFAEKAGRADLRLILHARASGSAAVESLIARYVLLTARAGESIYADIGNPLVWELRQIGKRVGAEIHRYQGILRFRKLENGLYYAAIEPDADVLPFLGPRMARRFRDQLFCIHDCRRQTAFWHEGSRSSSTGTRRSTDTDSVPTQCAEAEEEGRFQALWRRYFREIAITERKNPRLQRMKLPIRYWRYLPELEG